MSKVNLIADDGSIISNASILLSKTKKKCLSRRAASTNGRQRVKGLLPSETQISAPLHVLSWARVRLTLSNCIRNSLLQAVCEIYLLCLRRCESGDVAHRRLIVVCVGCVRVLVPYSSLFGCRVRYLSKLSRCCRSQTGRLDRNMRCALLGTLLVVVPEFGCPSMQAPKSSWESRCL